MKEVPPVQAWGMGGRQVCLGTEYGDQFDHQAVLQRAPEPFHAAFGLRRQSKEWGDPQRFQRRAHLRGILPPGELFVQAPSVVVSFERAVTILVEAAWDAIRGDELAEDGEVGGAGFRREELRAHHHASSIVDRRQQTTRGVCGPEPVVLTAVPEQHGSHRRFPLPPFMMRPPHAAGMLGRDPRCPAHPRHRRPREHDPFPDRE